MNNNSTKNTKQKRVTKVLEKSFDEDVKDVINGQRDISSKVIKRYIDCVVSPSTSRPSGIPTNVSYPGRTGTIKVKQTGTFFTGTNGDGYVAIMAPNRSGPYNDNVAVVHTASTYASATYAFTSATTGVVWDYWDRSPYPAFANARDLGFRCVGFEIKVKPISSLTTQSGRISLIEGSESLGGLTFANLSTFPWARNISAIAWNDPKTEIVVNYHPRHQIDAQSSSADSDGLPSPFAWCYIPNSAIQTKLAVTATKVPMGVFVSAAAGLEFSFEAVAVYELVGITVANLRHRAIDSRGMDLAMMAFANKTQSGYIGIQPEHAKVSYMAGLWREIKKEVGHLEPGLKRLVSKGTDRALDSLAGLVGL